MRSNLKITLGLALVLAIGASTTVMAGLSPEEIAKLGNELTPFGADRMQVDLLAAEAQRLR